MTAYDWFGNYVVAWYPTRWVAWFRQDRDGRWVVAAAGHGTHTGHSGQIHRPALVQPPTEGDTAA